VCVAALQKRCNRLRAGLDLIIDQRGADMPICPAAPAGAGARPQWKGSRPGEVYRIDPGVVSLVAGRGDERQAAEEF
jgi:hypothetical protein